MAVIAAAAWLNLCELTLNQQPPPACTTSSAKRKRVWRTGPIMPVEVEVGLLSGIVSRF